jgi:hypothetical protein
MEDFTIDKNHLGGINNTEINTEEIIKASNADSDEKVRLVEKTKNVYVLEKLSYSQDLDIKASVAGNTNCHEVTLLRLAKDKNEYIRNIVANNKKISRRIINLLKEDENLRVICSLILNDNIELIDIKFIYGKFKGNERVERCIARCEKTPTKILIELY